MFTIEYVSRTGDLSAMIEFEYRALNKPREVAPEQCTSDDTQFVYSWWRAKCGSRIGPSWREINLLELPAAVIPRVLVVDVSYQPMDFTYRFFGTWHVTSHNKDMSGRRVNDFEFAAYRQELTKGYTAVVRRRKPILHHLHINLNRLTYRSERLRLPLSEDGKQVDGIISIESLRPPSIAEPPMAAPETIRQVQ